MDYVRGIEKWNLTYQMKGKKDALSQRLSVIDVVFLRKCQIKKGFVTLAQFGSMLNGFLKN